MRQFIQNKVKAEVAIDILIYKSTNTKQTCSEETSAKQTHAKIPLSNKI